MNMASWRDKWKIANDLMMMFNAYRVKQVGSTNRMYCGILTFFNKPVWMQRKSSCSFVLNQLSQEGLPFAEVESGLLCEKSIYCNHPFSLSHLGMMILISVSYSNAAEYSFNIGCIKQCLTDRCVALFLRNPGGI